MGKSENPIAIDRLSGTRFGSSEQVYADTQSKGNWTVDTIKLRASSLGKLFNPSPEISGRLEQDLKEGALVLFTEDEVRKAIEERKIPSEWQKDLLELVGKINDIAVIPNESLNRWKNQQAIMSNKC